MVHAMNFLSPSDERLLRHAAVYAASAPAASSSLKTVVLIGPPNSGKSTLSIRLTGLRQKWPTTPASPVEQRMGSWPASAAMTSPHRLAGIYSLTPYSEDAASPSTCCAAKCPHAQTRRRHPRPRRPSPHPPAHARRAGA